MTKVSQVEEELDAVADIMVENISMFCVSSAQALAIQMLLSTVESP